MWPISPVRGMENEHSSCSRHMLPLRSSFSISSPMRGLVSLTNKMVRNLGALIMNSWPHPEFCLIFSIFPWNWEMGSIQVLLMWGHSSAALKLHQQPPNFISKFPLAFYIAWRWTGTWVFASLSKTHVPCLNPLCFTIQTRTWGLMSVFLNTNEKPIGISNWLPFIMDGWKWSILD